jgi:repressor LexA
MKQPLTPAQQEVYDYMRDYFAANDQLPSGFALMDRFGWTSPNSVNDFRIHLAQRGWIEKNQAGKYRFTREAT